MKKIRKNKKLIIVSILIIIIGLSIIGFHFLNDINQSIIEDNAIEDFFKKRSDNLSSNKSSKKSNKSFNKIKYDAIIEIPKINLKKGFFNINSIYNNVNYGIEIIKDSIMPNESNSNLILASHSGNSRASYFNNINKLALNDHIYIYYDNIKYTYKIINIYSIEKNGYLNINNDKNNTLTLITCKKRTNKQLIIIGILIDTMIY